MPGDRLTLADADGPPRPLRIADVPKYSKPLQAFPFDATNRLVRDGSRFNKVLLLRLDPETMDEKTRKHSIDGVVAFSSICTHQGCDVTEWLAADKDLMCFCHFSKFDPAHGAQVVAGPAPRSLPALPLTSVDGELVVRGTFTTTPGPTTTN